MNTDHPIPAKESEGDTAFADALKRIATAGEASSRAAVEGSKSTKPSLHTRFAFDHAKGV
jgi:hypothetical protein